MGEIRDLGVTANIVEKSGSWFSYNSERIGQGRENAKAYLVENPAVAAQLEALIRQNAGLIADERMIGAEGDDGGDDGDGEEDAVDAGAGAETEIVADVEAQPTEHAFDVKPVKPSKAVKKEKAAGE